MYVCVYLYSVCGYIEITAFVCLSVCVSVCFVILSKCKMLILFLLLLLVLGGRAS